MSTESVGEHGDRHGVMGWGRVPSEKKKEGVQIQSRDIMALCRLVLVINVCATGTPEAPGIQNYRAGKRDSDLLVLVQYEVPLRPQGRLGRDDTRNEFNSPATAPTSLGIDFNEVQLLSLAYPSPSPELPF